MLNNANGASVWTQLVQITALTNWLDSSQQSWGVCQDPVLGAGRRTLSSRRSSRTRAPSISAGGDWRASAGGWGAGGWEGLLTLYFPPREDIPGLGGRGRGGGGGSSTPAPPGIGAPMQVSRLGEKSSLELMTNTATGTRSLRFPGKPEPTKQKLGVSDRRLTIFQKKGVGGGRNLAAANSRQQLVQREPSPGRSPRPQPVALGHVPALIRKCHVENQQVAHLKRTQR